MSPGKLWEMDQVGLTLLAKGFAVVEMLMFLVLQSNLVHPAWYGAIVFLVGGVG